MRLKELELKNISPDLSIEDRETGGQDIAVIGIALRTAFADNVDDFWKNLCKGKECIHEIPDSRQEDIDNYLPYFFKTKLDAAAKNNKKRYLEAGYLDEIDKFDYRFFKLSPKEASLMDPCQRIFLETAYEVLEDAGYAGQNLAKTNTGVYVGYSDDVKVNYFQMVSQIEPGSIPMAIAGNLSSIVPGRVSYFLDLKGPSILIDTACSSSLVAVHLACQGIRNGDCDQAIAGGVRINLFPIAHKAVIGIESADGRTRTFSDDSDGTGSGEGSAAVLLKPLDKAVKDRDTIYAVLKGSAVNQDGQSLGITAPSVKAQTEVILKAWRNAGIDPQTISYIEAHGTGTRIGDPIEVEALKNAVERFTNRKQFCAIGSVKANLGHLFEAAGIFSLVKAVLSLKYKKLPPLIHFRRPNRDITFEDSPLYVNDELRDWKSGEFPLRCGVTAFGFSGTNCHVVLEQAPRQQRPGRIKKADTQHGDRFKFLPLSAKSQESLIKLVERYKDFLKRNKSLALTDICYTASTGREHFNHRIAFIIEDFLELTAKLELIKAGNITQLQENNIFYGEFKSGRQHDKTGRDNSSDGTGFNNNFVDRGNIKMKEYIESGRKDKDLLKEIAQLYVKGADPDWSLLYGNMTNRKVRLPLYPFARERCWIDIPAYEEDVTRPLEGKLFFNMEWIEEELQKNREKEPTGTVVILNDEKGIGEQISRILRQEGQDVVEVTFGVEFKEQRDNCFQVDYSESDYEKLLLRLEDRKITKIIFLAAVVQDAPITSLKQLFKIQERGVYNLFHLTKMVLKHYSTEKIEYIVIADYVTNVSGKEKTIKPENAPVFGLAYAIDRECENITTRCIDIDESVTAAEIVAELLSEKVYRAAAYRKNKRYCERFIPVEIENIPDDTIEFKEKGVYLITGGTGGIGLEVAQYLADKKRGINIALLNRSKMPDPGLWENILDQDEDKKTCRKIKAIREITEKGANVYFFGADAAKLGQMKRVLVELREKFGRINGVLHGAGVEGEGLLVRKEERKFANVLNPKVAGTWIVDHLTSGDTLDFFVLFSSVATFLMNPGQTDYTAANAYLDSFSAYRSRQGKRTLVVNWVTWKETGMAVDYNVNFDIIFKAIPTAQALAAFDIVLNKRINQILIGELNVNSKLINLLKNAQFRLSGQIQGIIDKPDSPMKTQTGDETGKKIRKVKLFGRENGRYTKAELLVAKVWGEVLGFDELRIDDNFYELGGDSILATQVVNRINTENNLKLSLVEIFNYETIEELARCVERST